MIFSTNKTRTESSSVVNTSYTLPIQTNIVTRTFLSGGMIDRIQKSTNCESCRGSK